MSDDVQVTVFLRPDTTIETFDRTHQDVPDLRVVGVHIGGVTMHISAPDDEGLAAAADRLIVALATLRNNARARTALASLSDPSEPKWLHETEEAFALHAHTRLMADIAATGWLEPELREAFGR